MPYVATDQNRYLGEHSCGRYHYGDMTLVRECCVADAVARADQAARVAMTEWHPAYRLFLAAENGLTNAEVDQLRKARPWSAGPLKGWPNA